MRIFLVRHGESAGNADVNVHRELADHVIPLTDKGHDHARAAGKFLNDWYDNDDQYQRGANGWKRPRLWVSPYKRTRQTADGIEAVMGKVDGPRGAKTLSRLLDRLEHPLLVEQQFGLFDGLSNEECAEQFPVENDHYLKLRRHGGRFWAPQPMGENRFQVAQRVHQAFGTFHRDADKHGIQDLIIVSHGVTLRAFVLMWCHKPVEWIETEKNPRNCSIRLLEGSEDKGYVFPGFEP
jgi:broad specificity phosphatase PhoE